MKYILSLYWFICAVQLNAQHGKRIIVPFNDSWAFSKNAQTVVDSSSSSLQWQPVQLPHTWNIDDVMDDVPGYYRGVSWYRKTFKVDAKWKGRQVFLFFEGSNQTTTVYINGKKAGTHAGGYTSFYIPIDQYLNWNGRNEVLAKVDNSYDQDIPPLSADFTFYGGIYRDVSLVIINPIHFSTTDHGGKSIYISTPLVNREKALTQIKGILINEERKPRQVKILSSIHDGNGKDIVSKATTLSMKPGEEQRFILEMPALHRPHLWSPNDPYLYKSVTRIIDVSSGAVLDEMISALGFRWFRFDAEKGFFLNDQPCKLIGASRHQDYPGFGNAVPDAIALKDVMLLKKMGANFLRVAHYPHDPSVLQACDSLGLLASVEIPIVNEITESDSFYNNCERMQLEMIKQNFNHPSVIVWCYMNEVLLRPHFSNDKERQKIYFSSITKLAKRLDSITRAADPERYTMIAHHGDLKKYKEVGLIDIPMVVGWNLYSGWYGAALTDFPVFLDEFHKQYPNKPVLVTEYGADADPRIRSKEPVRFDKSVEYTTNFHRYYLATMMKRDFVSAAVVWNLADFNSETRMETMPHINNKGLLEWDRTPKDPYYFYQAILLKKPFIKILGPALRGGVADSAGTCYQSLQVASNLGTLRLTINGKFAGDMKVENGIGELNIPFVNGVNHIEVRATGREGTVVDSVKVSCAVEPYYLNGKMLAFQQINILLGAKRSFLEKEKRMVWLPDQPYREGSWGYIGGKPFHIPGNGRLPYGTDKNIAGTFDDPIYQTQQTGIEKYKLDVPAGEYELTLHFAELQGGAVKVLPYDLSGSGRNEETLKRIFDVYVNNVKMLDHFNIAGQYGTATAVSRSTRVIVTNTDGIEIVFKSIEGEPVLNALQLQRVEEGVVTQ